MVGISKWSKLLCASIKVSMQIKWKLEIRTLKKKLLKYERSWMKLKLWYIYFTQVVYITVENFKFVR